jgi:hypothetical protein
MIVRPFHVMDLATLGFKSLTSPQSCHHAVACPTFGLSVRPHIKIITFKFVSTDTVSLSGIDCGQARAAQHVNAIRHWFQMIGIDACPISAQVVNGHSFWNLAFDQFVGETVRQDVMIAYLERAIAVVVIDSSRPKPAVVVSLIYMQPEAWFYYSRIYYSTLSSQQRQAADARLLKGLRVSRLLFFGWWVK